ncbi:hypothetical protein ACTXMG_05090 [Corynebacterium flavescens]|uniref:hypothetical protein n=1 Tax=Corynebacterium flavescens TaxID=28028 RepID=UPI003FD170A7
MANYALKAGGSRTVPQAPVIFIEVFETGAGGAALELQIEGAGVDATRVDKRRLSVRGIVGSASIVVRPPLGATFGTSSSVQLRVDTGEHQLDFPRVLVDAAEDEGEHLADVVAADGSYRFLAYGSDAGTKYSAEAREVRSTVRREDLEGVALSEFRVIVDSSASMAVNTSRDAIAAIARYIDGLRVGYTARSFSITDGQASSQNTEVPQLEEFVTKIIAAGADRVGSRRWDAQRERTRGADTLTVYVTDGPTSDMFESSAPTAVLITGPIARQERELARKSAGRAPVAFAVIDDEAIAELKQGNAAGLAQLSEQVAQLLKEKK